MVYLTLFSLYYRNPLFWKFITPKIFRTAHQRFRAAHIVEISKFEVWETNVWTYCGMWENFRLTQKYTGFNIWVFIVVLRYRDFVLWLILQILDFTIELYDQIVFMKLYFRELYLMYLCVIRISLLQAHREFILTTVTVDFRLRYCLGRGARHRP